MTLYDRKAARAPPSINHIPDAPLKARDTFEIALEKLNHVTKFPFIDRRATVIMESSAVQQLRDNLDSTAAFLKRASEERQLAET